MKIMKTAALILATTGFLLLALLSALPIQTLAFTEITENISSDTVWNESNSPYIIYDPISVSAGATLYVEPGAIVKFGSGSFLNVEGRLVS